MKERVAQKAATSTRVAGGDREHSLGWLSTLRSLIRAGIGRRLALLILAFSSVVTLAFTVFQLSLEYRSDVNAIESRLNQIDVSYSQSLAASLWVTSDNDLKLQLEGIMRLPDMQYVEVRSETGAIVTTAGVATAESIISREIPLHYKHLDRDVSLGSVRVVASLNGVYQRLMDKVLVIIVTQGIKTFLVSFFILFLFQAMVGRYLRKIASYSARLEPSDMAAPLDLEREVSSTEASDELEQMTQGINAMRIRLMSYIQELAASKEQLAVTLDSIGDAVVATDTEGRVRGMNPTAEHLTGWSRDEAVGRQLSEIFFIINSRTRELAASPVQRVLKEGVMVGLTNHTALIARDGTEYQIADSAAPIRDKTGQLHGVVLVFRDVSAAYRAQQAVKLFKDTLDQTRDSVVMFDADDLRIFYANKSTLEQLGYTQAEILELGMPDINAEYTAESFKRRAAPLIDGSITSWDERTVRRHKDGRLIDVELEIQLVRPEHQHAHFVTIGRDISERIRSETEQRIAAIAFQAQEGIVITDANKRVLRVNQAFSDITGYSADDCKGQTPQFLDSGRHDEVFFEHIDAELGSKGSWSGEIWCRRKNHEVYPEWRTIRVVQDGAGTITAYVYTHTDITQRKEAEAEISNLAFYDTLTQLPNRRLLRERLEHELAAGVRAQRQGALIFLDLDNFKALNDTQGHHVGDQLLIEVARRLQTSVRLSDTVARLGGDEFVVMLEDTGEGGLAATHAETVAAKIQSELRKPYLLSNSLQAQGGSTITYHGSSSIGIAMYSSGEDTVDDLLRRADLAMYQAKAAGRNTLRFFDPKMQSLAMDRASMEADMRASLDREDFLLYYQIQVDQHGQRIGVEALLRWQHPERGMVSPAEFIPLAEDTGLILPLGYWVLETACLQLVAWASEPEHEPLCIAVNVSARQFKQADFVEQVLAVLRRTRANPKRLKLELTESMLLDDINKVIEKMSSLRNIGIGFSLDDFGTGYSSLSYLKRLPLDQLKIDASFVRDLLKDKDDATIVKTIVALGQSLGMSVIAEGVETEEQRDYLEQSGCLLYQGYLFGRPVPIELL